MVPGVETRPIGDRPKEALFNILRNGIQKSLFLDMFAGTGSVGIEALSRGADLCVFLDINQKAIHTINANLELTDLRDRATVLRKDAFLYVAGETEMAFDYVYVAPPQYHGLWLKALETIDTHNQCLNPDAWIITQIHPHEYEPQSLKTLVEFDQRRYGNTLLVFYEYPGE
jgi:16S rRNA (guanine(966)-N(2))-methyltransferase RsmD